MYTTLLMSTGLTFGSISALFGLTNHIIDQPQYTILVTAVIGSAVVPILIAQAWFQPEFKPMAHDAEVLQAEKIAGQEPQGTGHTQSQAQKRQPTLPPPFAARGFGVDTSDEARTAPDLDSVMPSCELLCLGHRPGVVRRFDSARLGDLPIMVQQQQAIDRHRRFLHP